MFASLISFVPYFLAAAACVLLRNKEWLAALVNLVILVYLLYSHSQKVIVATIAFATLFTAACYVCIRYFNLFKFTNAKITPPVPLWLLPTWAIVALFANHLFGTINKIK